MRIGRHTNRVSCEFEMQEVFSKFLTSLGKTYAEEVHVKEVNRRADFLLIEAGLTNVEAKCNDWETLFKQLNDHATYCDYSFAYITNVCMTPKWFKKKLKKRGYGLIIYDVENKVAVEALEAHHNKPENRLLRSKMLARIRLPQLENQLV